MAQDNLNPQIPAQFLHYRIPKALFTEPCYDDLSNDAKLLYSLFLDRMYLSAKNEWIDKQGHVYIIYTINEIMKIMKCAREKAVKLLDELENNFDLIERKHQGRGKPSLIYIKQFQEFRETDHLEFENRTPGSSEIEPQVVRISNSEKFEYRTPGSSETELQPVRISNCNNTNHSNNNQSDTHSNHLEPANERMQSQEHFKKQLEFDSLQNEHPEEIEILNGILDLLTDTVCSTKQTIHIGGSDIPLNDVKYAFGKLNKQRIDHVLKCLSNNTTDIRCPKQYLLTTLYNASNTYGLHCRPATNLDKVQSVSADSAAKKNKNEFLNYTQRNHSEQYYENLERELILRDFKDNE